MYTVEPTNQFKKQYKRLINKYPKSKEEFEKIFESLEKGDFVGEEYNNLGLPSGESVYKVRVANIDANKGKSGGFRLIYYVIVNDEWVYLLGVYTKSEVVNMKQSEIKEIIKKYCN